MTVSKITSRVGRGCTGSQSLPDTGYSVGPTSWLSHFFGLSVFNCEVKAHTCAMHLSGPFDFFWKISTVQTLCFQIIGGAKIVPF